MKTNMIPTDGLTPTQTFILSIMAVGVIIAFDLIFIALNKLYDLIKKRYKEWKKTKSKNCEK